MLDSSRLVRESPEEETPSFIATGDLVIPWA
jgi:hypothetical protein